MSPHSELLPAEAAPADPNIVDAAVSMARQRLAVAPGAEPEILRLGIDTAAILDQLGTDRECACAAVLHGLAGTSAALAAEDVAAKFGRGVAELLSGVGRTGQLEDLGTQESASAKDKHAAVRLESLRKMLLAMAQDVRVVLILLAHRVALMRARSAAPAAERARIARRTMDLYAPLANRLGVWQVKWELEDLSFRFLQPDLYKRIARLLDEKRTDRERYIEAVIRDLRDALKAAGVDGEVTGRPKHIYSIYRKMQRKQLDFDDLYDVRAVRVLVPEIPDCYTVLGVVHDLWQPVPGEFDDYVSHPKGNFYRSLHTAVIGPEGKPVEVQIRTFEMHHDSELGIAAHWRYKEGGTRNDRRFERHVAWLRQMLAWQADVAQPSSAAAATAPMALAEGPIYVLTPQGRVIDLPAGSTPVDFAYHLHTDLGHRCRGAKVDGAIVPLTYRLQNAQRVEITAAKQGGPSRDWLIPEHGYLHSPRALAKVRQWFRQQHLERDIAQGRAVLEREMHRVGVSQSNFEKLAQQMKFARTEDFFAALGRGEITPRQLYALLERPVTVEEPEFHAPTDKPASGGTTGVLVLGVSNIATALARCCKPVRPEPIVGFVTTGRGVSIHRIDCTSLQAMRSEQRDRIIPASWGDARDLSCAVDIALDAQDRRGLLRDVSEVMTRERVDVTAVNTLSRGDQARMLFTCEVDDLSHLVRVLAALRNVPGVFTATRR